MSPSPCKAKDRQPANKICNAPPPSLQILSILQILKSCQKSERSAPSRAFSLIEVVLALGVISFAIVGIMGLLPVAMRTGLESQRETRATLIARQIFSDLQAGPATNTFLATTPGNFQTVNLSTNGTNTIYYNNQGEPAGTTDPGDSEFEVNLIITPDTPTDGLAHVQVDVAAPAQAPEGNRTTNTFVTLMRQ